MQVVDSSGNVFGQGLEITDKNGKPKVPVINTDITIGTTAIVGGVSGRLLYDNAGVVGETGGINWNPITSALSLFDSSFNSQAGNVSANTSFSITGAASSNYTIYSSRQFIFNTGQSMYFNTDTDGGSALDRAWYFAGARSGLTGGRTYGALTVDSSGFPSFTLYNNDNGARILLASNATSYFNGGNLIVGGNVDAGFKCDIIGSARVTSLKTADIFPASASISLWTNSLNATSRFYTAPVHQDGRINFNAIAGGSDYAIIRAWHTGSFGLGTGSSATNAALTVRGDTLLVGPSGALYFMNGTFGPNNVPYRLAISTTATTTSFYSGVGNNLTNIESTKFEYTATSHTFYTGTTAGNQANPNQYTPLHLSNLGNVTIGSTTDAGYKLNVNGTGRFTGNLTINNDMVINSAGDRSITWAVNDLRFMVGANNIARFFTTGTVFISTVGVATSTGTSVGPTMAGITASSATASATFFATPQVNHLQTKMLIGGNDGAYGGNVSTQGIGLWIYGGNNTTNNSYGNVVIGHDGTVARGNVLVGTSTNVASSKLTVESTTQGFLPPRMSNAQMLAIATPAEGLVVYDLTNKKLCCYDGTTWQNLF